IPRKSAIRRKEEQPTAVAASERFDRASQGDRYLTTAIEQTVETYGIENWGAGYFDVNRKGNLIVRPAEGDSRSADVREIIEDLARRGITTPVLLRFPQLVAAQVRKLQRAFSKSIREYEYQGAHMCVYPMKVNQQRAVVEEYLREGSRYDFGLEAGSKAELYAALALEQSPDSLLVLNGFKDEEFIEMAFAGAKSGKREPADHRHAGETVLEGFRALGKIRRRSGQVRSDHNRVAGGDQ